MAALRTEDSDDDVIFLHSSSASSSSSSSSAGAADGSGGGGSGGGSPSVLIFPEGEEEAIPEMSWTPSPAANVVLPWEGASPPYSINTRSEALKTFNKLTGNVFAKLKQSDWQGIVVAGGITLASLLAYGKGEINNMYPNSDIDVFLYALNEQEAKQKLTSLTKKLQTAQKCFVRTPHTITCVTNHRNVQIILRLHDNAVDVIEAFDVDCCGVLFDGTSFIATERAVRAISTGLNLADYDRRSWSFESRLVKYSRRGFGVAIKGAPADFREQVAWIFEDELPEEKEAKEAAKRAKTETGAASSSSSYGYYFGRAKKADGVDTTIPQLLGHLDWSYEEYFETKGVLKLLCAEYLRKQRARLAKERNRTRFVPNGKYGVEFAAHKIGAVGDDYGPSCYWPGASKYEISSTITKFVAERNVKKRWAVHFEIGAIPTGDAIVVNTAKGVRRDDIFKGVYRTNK